MNLALIRSRVAGLVPLLALVAACRTAPVAAGPTALEGQRIFRFDTFGDEAFWTDTLRMHEVIEGAGLGGVGPGVSPATALAAGLKVDLDTLPPSLVAALKAGQVDLTTPATTVALLKLGAVVGVRATVDSDANDSLHAPGDAGTDPLLAARGTTGKYRTTPLRGLCSIHRISMTAARRRSKRWSTITTSGSTCA